MFKAIQTSVSGLIASTVRANTAASNIVNSTVPSPKFTPHHVVQSTTSTGGVRANVVATSPSSLSTFNPTSFFTNSQSNAADSSNISLPAEIGELTRARYTYEANAKVIRSLDETFKILLKI